MLLLITGLNGLYELAGILISPSHRLSEPEVRRGERAHVNVQILNSSWLLGPKGSMSFGEKSFKPGAVYGFFVLEVRVTEDGIAQAKAQGG
jgi:hypothetical protein